MNESVYVQQKLSIREYFLKQKTAFHRYATGNRLFLCWVQIRLRVQVR